jgi:hypothetical protein
MGLRMCGYQNKPSLQEQDSEGSRVRYHSSVGSLSGGETLSIEIPVKFVVDSDNYLTPCSAEMKDRRLSEIWMAASAKSIPSCKSRPRFSISVLKDAIIAARRDSISITGPLTPMWTDFTATPSYIPLPMTKVLSTLYIGTYDNATNEEELKWNGITHILGLIGNKSSVNWVNHKQYVMSDYGKTNIKDVLNEVFKFMEEGQKGNNRLLVHCLSGQNRSAVVIISFLMMKAKKTLYRAHRELKKVRPIVQVNVGYAKQLLELEKELFGECSLPPNWMERQFDEIAEEVTYKYEDLKTARHRITMTEQKWE